MQKLPLNGGNAMKAEEFLLPAPVLGWRQAGQVLAALGSFSVWPFYGALLALLVGFHVQMSQVENGSAHLLPSAAAGVAKPASGTIKSSLPVNVGPPATSRLMQSGNAAPQSGNPMPQSQAAPGQPRQIPPSLSPLKAPVQPPAVRYPSAPPVRFPQNGVLPQNSAPTQVPNAGGTPALQPPAPAPAGASPTGSPAIPPSPDIPR